MLSQSSDPLVFSLIPSTCKEMSNLPLTQPRASLLPPSQYPGTHFCGRLADLVGEDPSMFTWERFAGYMGYHVLEVTQTHSHSFFPFIHSINTC